MALLTMTKINVNAAVECRFLTHEGTFPAF
jgi:hypothetical protein